MSCMNGWPSSKRIYILFQLRSELAVFNQHCMTCAVIPESLRARVLTKAHDSRPGIVRMKQRYTETVWWPNMNSKLNNLSLNVKGVHEVGSPSSPCTPLYILSNGQFVHGSISKLTLSVNASLLQNRTST